MRGSARSQLASRAATPTATACDELEGPIRVLRAAKWAHIHRQTMTRHCYRPTHLFEAFRMPPAPGEIDSDSSAGSVCFCTQTHTQCPNLATGSLPWLLPWGQGEAVMREPTLRESFVAIPKKNETMSMTLATRLSQVSIDEVPHDILELAKGRILEGIAIAFGGASFQLSEMVVEALNQGGGRSTIIGHSSTAQLMDASFANGVLCHSYSQQDDGIAGHPSAIVVPAALAAAEFDHASGADLLAGIVAGYETAGRIGDGLTPQFLERGFRTVPAVGPLSASAAAARVFGLSAQQTSHAIGIAANFAGGTYQGHTDGTMDGALQAGSAVRGGVTAAWLARSGVTSTPFALEGEHGYFKTFSGSLDNAYRVVDHAEDFAISRTFSKPYVGCYLNQELMDMARTVGERSAVGVTRVRLTIESHHLLVPGLDRYPPYESMLQAYMSLPFCVAAAILGRPLDDPLFFYSSFADPEVARLAQKVEVHTEPSRGHPRLEVLFGDHEESLVIDEDRSYIGVPTLERAVDRFLRHSAPVLGDGASNTVEAVRSLESLGDVHPLMTALVPPTVVGINRDDRSAEQDQSH